MKTMLFGQNGDVSCSCQTMLESGFGSCPYQILLFRLGPIRTTNNEPNPESYQIIFLN